MKILLILVALLIEPTVHDTFLSYKDIIYNNKDILEAHNKARSKHGVESLKWNTELQKFAQDWCDYLRDNKAFKHSSRNSGYGENLAMRTGRLENINLSYWAVEAWYAEELVYDYDNPGWQMEAGHFTQIVWRDTTQIGCAQSSGGGSNWVRICCEY